MMRMHQYDCNNLKLRFLNVQTFTMQRSTLDLTTTTLPWLMC